MRVLVCGSRDWTDEDAVDRVLAPILYGHEDDEFVLIHGQAEGADKLSEVVLRDISPHGEEENDFRVRRFPANWGKYGGAAGFIRNQQMLDEGKPDLVLAFWKNKSRGTADMIRRARKAGVEVRVIEG